MNRSADGPDHQPGEEPVDPVLQRLLPRFVANRRCDVAVILQNLERNEFERLEQMGHNLKGTGRSYGYDGISEIGRALEDAARTRDASEVRRQADALERFLEGVKHSL